MLLSSHQVPETLEFIQRNLGSKSASLQQTLFSVLGVQGCADERAD